MAHFGPLVGDVCRPDFAVCAVTHASDSTTDRLDSWKEIAAYLRRGVRTVRRWEREEGLPVHRHVHRVLGSVYAFKSEIDLWQRADRALAVARESPDRARRARLGHSRLPCSRSPT